MLDTGGFGLILHFFKHNTYRVVIMRIFRFLFITKLFFLLASPLFCQTIYTGLTSEDIPYEKLFHGKNFYSKLDYFFPDEIISTDEFLGIKVTPCSELFSYKDYDKFRTSPIVSGVRKNENISLSSINTKRRTEEAFYIQYKDRKSGKQMEFKTEPINVKRVEELVKKYNSIAGVSLAGLIYVPKASHYAVYPYQFIQDHYKDAVATYNKLSRDKGLTPPDITKKELLDIANKLNVYDIVPPDDLIEHSAFPTLTLSGFFYVFELDNMNSKYSRYFESFCQAEDIPYVRGYGFKKIYTGDYSYHIVIRRSIAHKILHKDPESSFIGSLARRLKHDKNFLDNHMIIPFIDLEDGDCVYTEDPSSIDYDNLYDYGVYERPVIAHKRITRYLIPAYSDTDNLLEDFNDYVQMIREDIQNRKK